MFFRTLRDLAKPQIVAIFDVLKRSDGLAVGDLAEALKMSYMGVKQYCIELEKRGYLDTWRKARETGRPELTYRLTPKAQLLFPQYSNELSMEILDAVRRLHGPTAAEKILYQYFLRKTESYSKKIKGKSLIERASSLAKLRENEGHCAQVDYDPRHGLRLTEYHSPLSDLIKTYPSVAKMEESMLSKLLQAAVHREMSVISGLMRITFLVAGASLPPAAPSAPAVRTQSPARSKTVAEPPAADLDTLAAPLLEPTPLATEPVAASETAVTPTAAVVSEQVAVHVPAAASALHDPAAPVVSTEPVADPSRSQPLREEEPTLFTAPLDSTPVPRPHARTVVPARPFPKASEPDAEELLLSL